MKFAKIEVTKQKRRKPTSAVDEEQRMDQQVMPQTRSVIRICDSLLNFAFVLIIYTIIGLL